VVVLNNTYTLAQDTVNAQACNDYSSNASCKLSSETCTDGPSTKVLYPNGTSRLATPAEITAGTSVNGVVKYQACWKWNRDYSCLIGDYKNYCQPLVGAGCVESSAAVCRNTGWNGSCLEYDRTYNCGAKVDPPPSNVVYLNASYTITGETAPSTCGDPSSNPNCTKMGEPCIDGPATKVVLPTGATRLATPAEVASGLSQDGAVVTKACWETRSDYTCATTPKATTCGDLLADTACGEASQSCIDYLPGGQCGVLQHVFNCKTGPDKIENITDCGTQRFCSNGACFDNSYSPDRDIGQVVAGMEALREAGSYSIFVGEAGKCESKLWGGGNCCKAKSGGGSYSNYSMAGTIGASVLSYAGEWAVHLGSNYLFDALMDTGFIDWLSTYSVDAAGSLLDAAVTTPGFTLGGLSTYGFALSTTAPVATGSTMLLGSATAGGSTLYLTFNPYLLVAAVIIEVITEYLSCSTDEQKLSMKRGQGLCHKVGTYCSNKIMGSCESTKEAWCCFPSKLGRIINEQGRPQIGKNWGSASKPDCSGFTLEQLTLLRFDQMDFSEFYSSILPNVKDATAATQRLTARTAQPVQNYYSITPTKSY
jgi:conjugal transfer mating pair stabilization protein TraN